MRPETGPNNLDEHWDEMRRKYRRVGEAAAREGWTAAYDAALHENAGGRLSTAQLLVGSTLPLLPTLEEVVKEHALHLSGLPPPHSGSPPPQNGLPPPHSGSPPPPQVVKEHAPLLSRREAQITAVRVQMESLSHSGSPPPSV